MSDYGDEYSDYGDEWLYVEEEYVVADDLAEHAVPSPPPTVYDEDALLDWDRFDYYNDLEYASDGYDNASFEPNNGAGAAKIGQKRKRGATTTHERKRRRVSKPHTTAQGNSEISSNAPVVWRSQSNRGKKPRMLVEDTESYALLKDWRETAANAPQWARHASEPASPASLSAKKGKVHADSSTKAMSPVVDEDGWEDEEAEEEGDEGEEGGAELDPTALMAVLQERLAAAGGPLNGMDPQQLLQFAMRMAADKDAGDDIAGEMADEMLGMGDEEDEGGEAEENLLSWVAQQRNTGNNPLNGDSSAVAPTPKPPGESHARKEIPTSSTSEANHSVAVTDQTMTDVEPAEENVKASKKKTLEVKQVTRKRKATDTTDAEASTVSTKRRATRSFDAPTASSQAKTSALKTTRSGRVKR